MTLSGTTALVTGATSGIGAATAKRLAADGARVAVSGRSRERGDAVVAEIVAAGGYAVFVRADLLQPGAAAQLAVDAVEALGGRVDTLVNNAGIYVFAPATELSEADVEAMVRINLLAVHELTAALAPAMLERGSGSIVNVTSTVASKGMDGASIYGATKAAVDLLTKVWASEFGPAGVRVTAVSPGPIVTEGVEGFGNLIHELGAGLPSRRAGQPSEVAAAVAFLVGPDAGFVQGTSLSVDGGGLAV